MIKKIKEEQGQAALELAIIMPIIILIIVIMVFLGMFVFTKSVVLIAAHGGGREGLHNWNLNSISQAEKESAMRETVFESLEMLPGGESSEITITDDLTGKLTVKVRYFFQLNLPFIDEITGGEGIPINAIVSYRYVTEEDF